MVDPVTELLVNARALWKSPNDWCTGTRNNGDGGHCALGVLDIAAYGAPYASEDDVSATKKVYNRALVALADAIPDPYRFRSEFAPDEAEWTIANYNNASSYETVIKWFDRVIAMRKLLTVNDDELLSV